MDQKGFIATWDALMGLIVLLIILASFSIQINQSQNSPTPEPRINTAQDIMEQMINFEPTPGEGSLLEKMVIILDEGNLSADSQNEAGIISGKFLNQSNPGINYNLTEINHLKGKTLCATGPMREGTNINSAQRNYGGYCFQLYVWY